MIPPFFALDPPWKQGDARRWMTSESACFGAGNPPERWAAPTYLAHKNYPQNFVRAVEQHESLKEWPTFPTADDKVCDGDEVCKPFPTEADLAGATGGSFGSLLKAFEAAVNAGEVRPQSHVQLALHLRARFTLPCRLTHLRKRNPHPTPPPASDETPITRRPMHGKNCSTARCDARTSRRQLLRFGDEAVLARADRVHFKAIHD